MSDGTRCEGYITEKREKNLIKNEIKGHIEKENDGESIEKRKTHKKRQGLDLK